MLILPLLTSIKITFVIWITVKIGKVTAKERLTRAEAKARTREQLLDAAAVVFAEKGYAGASVDEIAEAAGYTTGALYSNFGSKEKLFLELMSAWRSQNISRQAALVARIVDEDGPDPLALLVKRLENVDGRSTEAAALQAEFWLFAVRNPEAMRMLAEKTDERVEALTPLVSHVMWRHGATTAVPAETVTRIVLALFQGLARQRRIDPDSVPAELFTVGLEWMIAGLRAAT
jgi:AcrR family transcriptional regulator